MIPAMSVHRTTGPKMGPSGKNVICQQTSASHIQAVMYRTSQHRETNWNEFRTKRLVS